MARAYPLSARPTRTRTALGQFASPYFVASALAALNVYPHTPRAARALAPRLARNLPQCQSPNHQTPRRKTARPSTERVRYVERRAMPRIPLEPQFTVEHMSILDSDGNLDTALEPELSPEDLKRLYRAMLLGRRLDERMLKLQRQGRIGTFAPLKGQEASQIGTVFTLETR